MLKDIISLNAQGSYTRFDLINGTNHLTCKNIKEYEEILPANYFIRIHRSSIVNVNHITRYRRGDGGVVELINGMSMKVSRKRKEEFLRMYGVKKLT
jgi:two-component system LytT family response regulator